jgi:hypothetical protein
MRALEAAERKNDPAAIAKARRVLETVAVPAPR